MLMPGTEVEVVTRFSGDWASGFEVAAIDDGRYQLRRRSDRVVLPAGPDYRMEDEVKSIITVVAKTHHYWQAHVTGGEPA